MLTEQEIVEIGARALVSAAGHDPDEPMFADDALPIWHMASADMRAALAALHAAGLVLVPAEPTEAMIEAASEFHANGKWDVSEASIFGGIYRAMIAAAPPTDSKGAA